MDNNQEQLSEKESLFIIQQMIQSAKHEQKDDGKGWIIWGWMLFLASILTVLNIQTGWFQTFFFWNIFGLIAIVIAMYETFVTFFVKKKVRVKTYTKAIFEKLNAGFFISLMFIIVAMNIGIHPRLGFPSLMSLYGFWILIYGAILNFKPSIIGAACMWLLAFGALFVPSFQWVMVLHGIGVLCGYIIPGHIANREFKKVTARNINNQQGGV
jgi:MFS family permease